MGTAQAWLFGPILQLVAVPNQIALAPSTNVPHTISAMRLLLLATLSAVLGAQEPAASGPAPCDPGLEESTTPVAVFVRMRSQLFADGLAYPAYCRQHATTARSELRAKALTDLHQNAERSWQGVAATVQELQTAVSLRELQRFWIINGFAATATGAAVRALRRLPEVAFVHRQTQTRPQQRLVPRTNRWLQQSKRDEQRALELLATRGKEPAFSTDDLTIPWNLKAVRADAAWQLGATGDGVIIAMIDSGLLAFEPVVHALWQNPGEQHDGKDNDGNGFVDDLFGWDFDGDTRFVIGDGEKSHGTMCGGILAGRPWGEPRTVTGVAPRAKLMVLRGMGRLRAYEYAATMGADVLSMSYMWINLELGSYRGVFRTAHEHLAACGIVAVGGAGNFAKKAAAGHQITLPKDIPCVIAAAGIGEDAKAPSFSSRGPCTWHDVPFFMDYPAGAALHKPDVTGCAADVPVWHRTKLAGRQTEVLWQDEHGLGLIVGPRGNSFAGPHAGGTAALMLSAQPELTPWRVQALMIATCHDLGEAGWDATYGAGLLQADAAVQAARAAVIK